MRYTHNINYYEFILILRKIVHLQTQKILNKKQEIKFQKCQNKFKRVKSSIRYGTSLWS